MKANTSRPPAASHWQLALLLGFALAAVTLAVYSPVGSHPFIDYDDQAYVLQNSHVKAGLSWATFTWAWTATEASNWHPVTWLSHALDCELFGLNPAGPHWTNAILHSANVVLLFLLLWRGTGAIWRSLLVAALFALHPLNVESVAWIAERKNVLSAFFFLSTLGTYGYYARKPGIRRYLLVALAFALGLASKPMVITLPFVILLLDYWPLQRVAGWIEPSDVLQVEQAPFSRLVIEKLPLVALSVASAIITLVAQTASEVSSYALPLWVRIENSFYAYGAYVWKMPWPVNLALIYPHPGRLLPVWQPALNALLIIAVLYFGWKQRATRPYWIVGWLWYLGTAVPIIGIVQVGAQVVADRYAYLTLIGVFVATVWQLSDTLDARRIAWAPRAVVAGLAVLALAFLTVRQIRYWRSTVDLWTHALQVTENNSLAENSLANELFKLGQYGKGMEHLRAYARLEPLDPNAHARVGADYQDHGKIPDAIREFEAAIHASKALSVVDQKEFASDVVAVTYANLAICYAQLGNEGAARENAINAANINAAAVGQMIGGLERYLQQRPTAQGYVRLGLLLREFGHEPEAEQAFANARQLDPAVALP